MLNWFWDASALAKRYAVEKGSGLVNQCISRTTWSQRCLLNLAVGEVVSLLVRKLNAGAVTLAEFNKSLIALSQEISGNLAVEKLLADQAVVVASLPLIVKYSINSTDAVILWLACDRSTMKRSIGDQLVRSHRTGASSRRPRQRD